MSKRKGLIALLTLWCLPLIAAAAPAPVVGNLGDSLLDDDLAKSLSPAPEARPEPAGPGAFVPRDEMLDRLLKQGGAETAGEDVGESPLAGVVNGMRQAESLIRDDAKVKPAVPVQKQVVTRLDQLIAQMEKQCQGGNCNKPPSDQEKQASKRSQPKPGEGKKQGEGKKPGQASKKLAQKANQSGTSGSNAGISDTDPAEQQELLKAAWGHLPERMRERMLQGSDSEFLPEYRDELQQYYRRLAERSSREAP